VPDVSFDLLLILIAAFAAGVIDAMAGGGGLIQLPALFAVYPETPPPALLVRKYPPLLRARGDRA
jgi:uncharacterized membrane protein YfcA